MAVVYFAVPSFSCHLLNVSCAVAILRPILASNSYFSQVAAFSTHYKSYSQYYDYGKNSMTLSPEMLRLEFWQG